MNHNEPAKTKRHHGGGDGGRITVPLGSKGAVGSEADCGAMGSRLCKRRVRPSGAPGEGGRQRVEDSLGGGRWRRPTVKL
ncbi:hypothetical protein E2562_032031 [Oryza meyeriana var. granulata]|uniref:DUF834 domain-containing protein n=1 Tax=Oryza meyeriana var. granulata TaxID=110450 RepID=A0A6G1FEJ9_9ORYZ|nr:hypothetical protein E2562_032031 [Oryza meyeriana var. granulata]